MARSMRTEVYVGVLMLAVSLLATGCGLGLLGGGGSAASSPQELYNVLLDKPFEASELPSGFSSPKVTAWETVPSGIAKYHALGGVSIEFNGPDDSDFINYWIFPTLEDAAAQFSVPLTGINSAFVLLGMGLPAVCTTGSTTSSGTKYGVTACHVLLDQVHVVAVSWLSSQTQGGNDASAQMLARTAIAHLMRLKR